MKIAINGFGRIGRNFLRAVLQDPSAKKSIEVVVINIGPLNIEHVALLFEHDSLLGTYKGRIALVDGYLHIDDYRIKIISCMEPADAHWESYGVLWVVDCSGQFTTQDRARLHIDAGAQYVLISAPATGEDVVIIPGVNDALFDRKKHHIVSLGSCTSNAFLPILKVLNDEKCLLQGCMTTVHAYTNSQALLDDDRKDVRLARAAGLNIIPTSTGASGMIGKVIPDLEGKIMALSVRVPVAKVSFIDFTFCTNKTFTPEMLNDLFRKAAVEKMRGIIDVSDKPLVSSDYAGTDYSVVIDALSTQVNGTMARMCGWYDNEWAYSLRLKDFLLSVRT